MDHSAHIWVDFLRGERFRFIVPLRIMLLMAVPKGPEEQRIELVLIIAWVGIIDIPCISWMPRHPACVATVRHEHVEGCATNHSHRCRGHCRHDRRSLEGHRESCTSDESLNLRFRWCRTGHVRLWQNKDVTSGVRAGFAVAVSECRLGGRETASGPFVVTYAQPCPVSCVDVRSASGFG